MFAFGVEVVVAPPVSLVVTNSYTALIRPANHLKRITVNSKNAQLLNCMSICACVAFS